MLSVCSFVRVDSPAHPSAWGAVGFGLCKGPPSRLGICHGRAPTAAAHHYTHPHTVPASPLNGAGCAVRHVKASHELQPLHGPRSERCHCHHVPHQSFAIRRVRACGKAARHSAAAHAPNTLSHALSSRTRKSFAKLRQPLTADPMPRIISRYLIPEFAPSTLAALLKPHIESGLTPFAHDGSGVRAPDPSCWTGGLNKVRPLAEMCSTAHTVAVHGRSFFFSDEIPGDAGTAARRAGVRSLLGCVSYHRRCNGRPAKRTLSAAATGHRKRYRVAQRAPLPSTTREASLRSWLRV